MIPGTILEWGFSLAFNRGEPVPVVRAIRTG